MSAYGCEWHMASLRTQDYLMMVHIACYVLTLMNAVVKSVEIWLELEFLELEYFFIGQMLLDTQEMLLDT